MANTLTNLIPDIYGALDVVSRELTGFIPAAARDSSADQIADGQNLRVPIVPSNSTTADITPAMSFPAIADQTITPVTLTLTKKRYARFSWNGEEQKAMESGAEFAGLKQNQIAMAIRAIINEMELDLANAAYKASSRAFGTAGTTPFATTPGDLAQCRKILDDNGAPLTDRQLVIGTTAGVNLRSLANLYRVNESQDTSLLRQGVLQDMYGFAIRESAQVPTVTKGTGAAYTTTAAGFAVGTTSIPIITGAGTVLQGDVVTFAGDTNKYVVQTGVAAPGTIVLQSPGLRQAIPASATAMTIGNNYAANVAFSRNALLLATRVPAVPQEGDLATDRMVITDPRTGIALEFAVYPGFRMNVYTIGAAWGVLAVKGEHISTLLG